MNPVVRRKLLATYVSTTIIAMAMSTLWLLKGEVYDQQIEFPLITLTYGLFVGTIVLIYGNSVSALIEYVTIKSVKVNTFFFILLHGIFGLIMIQVPILATFAVSAALLYACIDRWFLIRTTNEKPVRMFILTPIVVFCSFWVYFLITSPSPPPFTAEDAVELATEGEGTVTDKFPKKVGSVSIGDVTRETSVKNIGKEVYIVTFKETWRSDDAGGPWFISYKVERSSVSLYDEG